MFKKQSKQAQQDYADGIANVLSNCKRFLAEDFDIFLVANDKHNLYPNIAETAGLQIAGQYKRPVLNRTEKDKGAYSEIIFHLKDKKCDFQTCKKNELQFRLLMKEQETNGSMKQISSKIIQGDCKEILQSIEDNSIDLVFTSPPYADRRKQTYGGVKPEDYVEWFLLISEQLLRVLKPTGTFVLNIKEKAENSERSTYVIKLILALRRQGWFWTEEFIWHKKNSYPGKWSNRFRDSWERLLQFNRNRKFNMYQDAVKVPVGDWAENRLKNLSQTDKIRDNAKNGNGFGKNVSNWIGRETVYPTNVLHLSTECNNKNHSAAFPDALPEWFIKLFTQEGDTVLDPFAGSGTTLRVAQELYRNSIGIEIVPEYVNLIESQLKENEALLFEELKTKYEITRPV